MTVTLGLQDEVIIVNVFFWFPIVFVTYSASRGVFIPALSANSLAFKAKSNSTVMIPLVGPVSRSETEAGMQHT